MADSQTSENESIVEHPTQLLKRQNHISYLHGFYTTDEQTSLMEMINEMRQQRDVHEYVSAMEKIREIGERKVPINEDNRDVIYEYTSARDKIKKMKCQKMEDDYEYKYPPPTFQSLSKINTVSDFNEWLLQEDTVYIGCYLKSQPIDHTSHEKMSSVVARIEFKLPWIECRHQYGKIEDEEYFKLVEDFYRKHYGSDKFHSFFGKRLGCFCEHEETCHFSVIKKICDEIREDYMIDGAIDIVGC